MAAVVGTKRDNQAGSILTAEIKQINFYETWIQKECNRSVRLPGFYSPTHVTKINRMYYGERFNSISHLVGAAAALAGMLVLVILASLQGDPWKIVSFSVYGASLVALYTFSTLYHSLRGKTKALFRKLDHNAIYLLIAGTYTPFVMVTLRDTMGWIIFGVVWLLASVGMVYDSFVKNRKRVIPVIVYLVMGWLALFILKPLVHALPTAAIVGLVAGGLFYTVGIIFYALDKVKSLDHVKHLHGIWHLFVLAGSTCHYLTILVFVA